jgi:nucleotide-binding universal stress UspA family protein
MHILIPTDFSDGAKQAIDFAILSFPNAKFTLIHTINPHQSGSTMMVNVNQEILDSTRPEMEKLVKELQSEQKNLNIKGYVEIGLFTQTLNEIVKAYKVDLVVLGTKGASGLQEILIGSNAATAIKNVITPIIVVPKNAKTHEVKNILLTSDYNNENEKNIINLVDENFNAKTELLHVKIPNETINEEYTKKAKELGPKISIVEAENAEQAILSHAHENNYDLIILTPKDRGIIRNLFHHSVTKKLSMHSDIPLLIWK